MFASFSGNALIVTLMALYFFIIPFGIIVSVLGDPGLHNGETPNFVYQWHHKLSDKFEPWANNRVDSRRASELGLNNISGTEWPIFSAVYFLWTTEALQAAWEENPLIFPIMPKEYAKGAIESAAKIISDPNHATWVKIHWGDDYLSQENLFYRMLLISGLTSYQKLLDDDQYESLLLNQVVSLSNELDASPFGLLDDYPGQCYPIDILPAIAAIQRADDVLGTDNSLFSERAIRAFETTRLDRQTNLPAYIANSRTGEGIGPARGVGISYMLIWAPELWPDTAHDWYESYENHFWQEGQMITGVREFSKDYEYNDWFVDVDAGPVVGGLGTAATAFGIGAARANGRFDHAYPLSAEALVASWPLLNGTLLGPRILSNLSDAPYVGETAILFNLTRMPNSDIIVLNEKRLPFIVYVALLFYLIFGLIPIGLTVRSIKQWHRDHITKFFPLPYLQFIIWVALLIIGIVAIIWTNIIVGIIIILLARFFPLGKQKNQLNDNSN